MLSNRINKIEESGIRKIFSLAAGNQGNYINLSIGQPDFSVPKKLKQAAKEAIKKNNNSYTQTQGDERLRKKIALKLNSENNIKAKSEDVIITAGVSGAIFLLFSAVFNPKDEVIVPDPYFVMYKQLLNFLDVKMIPLNIYPDFHLKGKNLEKLITPKTKAIIINSPNNPTGAVYGQDELREAAKIARKHNLLVISDEIYEKYDYGNKFFSIGSIYKNTVTLNGFSKSHSITGWRLGYAHGPKEIIKAINKLQQYTFVCAPSFAQEAVLNEFNLDIKKEVNNYKTNRDFLYNRLKDRYELNMPEGAFYAFIKISNGQKNFMEKAIKNKLLVVPGNVFSGRDDYFRVSFAVDKRTLEKGVKILLKMV
ncbi:aspartate aminotransferase [Candidatus Falkowbacteria bacterium]|nr:MAG: aspartate aminotransferase [Candidatus Falkowbacteria bacterium]